MNNRTVNPAGNVRGPVETIRHSRCYGFDVAAVEAVRQWEYEPTWLNGEPVSVRFTVTISFLPPRSEDQAPAEVERLRTRS